MIHVGDILSTSGDVQYIRANIRSTLGNIMIHVEELIDESI